MSFEKNLTEIEYSPVLGRYLVASEAVSESDVLIEEYPFAYGPKLSSPVVCLGCFVPVNCNLDGFRCPKCGWPLCQDCIISDGAEVHQKECEVFKSANAKFYVIKDDEYRKRNECVQLDCVMPLRVLLNKEIDPERWEREVAPMEYHDQSRRQMTEVWNADLVNIAQYLRGPCKLDRFSEDLIMRVVGILEVNAFEGRTSHGHTIRCLYPKTGILAHNCVPNTARSIYPSDRFRIRLRAMKDLKAGQQLHHSYTFTLNGTAARQEHIRNGKFFTCRCARCSDPTELGTYFSSFKCISCDLGFLSSIDPFDSTADWRCNHCRFTTPAEGILKNISTMQAEVADVQAMDMSPERLQECEALLRKYRMILHPSHYIQTSLKQSLIEMYGRVHGYEMVELPDILLERKEELCRQVLGVLNVFEPGLSRARAMLLYELHVPLVLLAKSGFIAKVLSLSNLKERIQEAVSILEESVSILKYEDPSSQEGLLGRVASKALESLKLSIEAM
ncbi:SET domain-containing protein SmydA-8 isoform X2 [Eupeodes corollae]|uniref:SET domain-containing protein SmydA-8 isoform X2 n=1 Tax=Eupeodes corollae TaxID=290404 RepID=UPI002490D5D5|nr:SET domain-containing protein SmydA-8 isoform X2 [Eupeodes corollae]